MNPPIAIKNYVVNEQVIFSLAAQKPIRDTSSSSGFGNLSNSFTGLDSLSPILIRTYLGKTIEIPRLMSQWVGLLLKNKCDLHMALTCAPRLGVRYAPRNNALIKHHNGLRNRWACACGCGKGTTKRQCEKAHLRLYCFIMKVREIFLRREHLHGFEKNTLEFKKSRTDHRVRHYCKYNVARYINMQIFISYYERKRKAGITIV